MTNKKCEGIDCAWCMSVECPNEKGSVITDKEQIMINGVDVSGCKFFNDITESYYCFGIPCKDRPNCCYKQLARKTQECEELKEKLYQIEDVVKPVNKQLPEDSIIRQIMLILNDCNKLEPSCYRKALKEIEEVADDYNRVGKTSQYYRDGFEQILNIINKAKGGNE